MEIGQVRILLTPLIAASRHGRLMLVAGLVAGIALPGIALAMKPWLPEMVAILLFIAALRIGPRQALGSLYDLPLTTGYVLCNQLAFPLLAAIALIQFGMVATLPATALMLMLAASPISGSPNLTIMTGNDPAPSLRALIIGTAFVPLTVIPVFWLVPAFGSGQEVMGSAARLLVLVAAAGAAAFAVRGYVLRTPDDDTLQALDGLSALAMAIIVVGLMSAVGPAIFDETASFARWLAFAFAINIGMQLLVYCLAARTGTARAAFAIGGGNRNIALFLAALPATITDPLLLFIGCYQIPMYLTPLVMARLYRPA